MSTIYSATNGHHVSVRSETRTRQATATVLVSSPEYRATCHACGWTEKGHTRPEVVARAKQHQEMPHR